MSEDYKITINQIEELPEAKFEIVISNSETTEHLATLNYAYYTELVAIIKAKNPSAEVSPKDLAEKSIEFLLKKELNTSILSSFSLKDIKNLFPDYEESVVNSF